MFKRLLAIPALVFAFVSNSFAALSADVQAVVDATNVTGLSSATSTLLVGAIGIVLIFVAYALSRKGLGKVARG